MEVKPHWFAEHGVVGQCACKAPVDVMAASGNNPIHIISIYACACLGCNQVWKSASSVKEAIDNFGNDNKEQLW